MVVTESFNTMDLKPVLCLLLLSIAFCKYSYLDKCYRFNDRNTTSVQTFYQIYVNRDGVPLSSDYIVEEGKNYEYDVSYYYHNILTDCEKKENGYYCTSTTESVWFKFTNLNGAHSSLVDQCEPIFQEKYANIMVHDCPGNKNAFIYIKKQIGKVSYSTVTFEDGKPVMPKMTPGGKCVWEWDILGLVSLITVVTIGSIIAAVLIVIIILIVITQKHRSNKRKRLDNSLLKQTHNVDSV